MMEEVNMKEAWEWRAAVEQGQAPMGLHGSHTKGPTVIARDATTVGGGDIGHTALEGMRLEGTNQHDVKGESEDTLLHT
jgi:hypothetical protein